MDVGVATLIGPIVVWVAKIVTERGGGEMKGERLPVQRVEVDGMDGPVLPDEVV